MAVLTMEVPRRHARTRAITSDTLFPANGPLRAGTMRREASRVSFLMCPFCVRGLLPHETTFCDPTRRLRLILTINLCSSRASGDSGGPAGYRRDSQDSVGVTLARR